MTLLNSRWLFLSCCVKNAFCRGKPTGGNQGNHSEHQLLETTGEQNAVRSCLQVSHRYLVGHFENRVLESDQIGLWLFCSDADCLFIQVGSETHVCYCKSHASLSCLMSWLVSLLAHVMSPLKQLRSESWLSGEARKSHTSRPPCFAKRKLLVLQTQSLWKYL